MDEAKEEDHIAWLAVFTAGDARARAEDDLAPRRAGGCGGNQAQGRG